MRRSVPLAFALTSALALLAMAVPSAAVGAIAASPAAVGVVAASPAAGAASPAAVGVVAASPAAGAASPAAGAARLANRIAPGQAFTGRVNGAFSDATVMVFCPGPLRPGQKGHPLAGQQLEVLSPLPPVAFGVTISVGQTGTRGRAIIARFAEDRSVPTVFLRYFVNRAIPTALWLPCSGTGKVTFSPVPTGPVPTAPVPTGPVPTAPVPTSPSARPSVVTVSYVNPAVLPLLAPRRG